MKQAVIVLQPIRLKSLDNKIITPDKVSISDAGICQVKYVAVVQQTSARLNKAD